MFGLAYYAIAWLNHTCCLNDLRNIHTWYFYWTVVTDCLDDLFTISGNAWSMVQAWWILEHFSSPVCDWLDMEYPYHWIKHKVSNFLAAKISRSELLYFFLHGHLIVLVYWDLVTIESDLVACLHVVCTVDNMLL